MTLPALFYIPRVNVDSPTSSSLCVACRGSLPYLFSTFRRSFFFAATTNTFASVFVLLSGATRAHLSGAHSRRSCGRVGWTWSGYGACSDLTMLCKTFTRTLHISPSQAWLAEKRSVMNRETAAGGCMNGKTGWWMKGSAAGFWTAEWSETEWGQLVSEEFTAQRPLLLAILRVKVLVASLFTMFDERGLLWCFSIYWQKPQYEDVKACVSI